MMTDDNDDLLCHGGLYCDPPPQRNVFSRGRDDDSAPFEGNQPSPLTGNHHRPTTTVPSTAPVVTSTISTSHPTTSPRPTSSSPTIATDLPQEGRGVGLPPCVIGNNNGSFGQGPNRASVAFIYQVQTKIDLNAIALQNSALLTVEKALANLLLKELFDGTLCSTYDNPANVRSLPVLPTTRDGSAITGISTLPDDRILPGLAGIQCQTPLVHGADRCFLVHGNFTLFGQGPINTWAPIEAGNATEQLMNSGRLNDAHPQVVNVRFITLDTNDPRFSNNNNNDDDGNVVTSSNNTNNRLEAWSWIVIASGILLVVTALLLARRKRRSSPVQENANMPTGSWRDVEGQYFSQQDTSPFLQDSRPVDPLFTHHEEETELHESLSSPNSVFI